MANREQLDILTQGVETWNQWRREHADIEVDLSGALLSDANLHKANLSKANLSGTNLSGADLSDANLSDAKVTEEQLKETKSLKGATLPDGSIHP